MKFVSGVDFRVNSLSMFESLKKVFARAEPKSQAKASGLAQWASGRGYVYSELGDQKGFSLVGKTRGKPWRLELGRASRAYIKGPELRARAELGLNEDISILVMNRPLKEALEARAYEIYTDSLQTTADPNLPEELRWLSMYPEFGWDGPPGGFWTRYSVLAERKEQGQGWLQPQLVEMLLNWPDPAPDAQIPFTLMILRGKAYLRMQYEATGSAVLEHVVDIFELACELGLTSIPEDEEDAA